MGEPSEAEKVALCDVGPLLRFASENVRDLDPDAPLAIAEAREAAATTTWTPHIAQRFWTAFNKLCQLIQPVTMDSIAAKYESIDGWKWFPPRKVRLSLATRSSGRYLLVLFLLISITVPLQLYAWLYSLESKKIDDLVNTLQTTATTVGASYTKLSVVQKGDWGASQTADALQMLQQIGAWNAALDRLTYHVEFLSKLSPHNHPHLQATTSAEPSPLNWVDAFTAVNRRSSQILLNAINVETTASLIAGVILSFVLPILFGMIGAVTFVIRTMSDQIKASTYSTTSPIRHLMRATLGALAGLVVGLFSNLSTQISLPPLAIAFLAGYGVEALFSMFDGFIAKFKTT